ncbi:MAG: TOBE domain-containing protein, partial [Pseudomonadota bacterium]
TLSDRLAVMNAGRVLQSGGPREIYDHPATRFVADFIGDTNFLDAEVLGVSGTKARLRLDSGTEIEAALPAGHTPQGQVALAIRPEHARPVAPEDGVLAGTVEEAVFLGTDTQVRMRLDTGTPFTMRVQNAGTGAPPPSPGTRLGIALAPGAAQVLRD